MSRKEGSFSQLLAYMEKGSSGERAPIFQNLHSGTIEDMIHAFEDNAQLLQKRKGGVFLYHEILSFKNNDTLSFGEKAEKLQEIAGEYLMRRSEHSLAYGVIHEDKAHHTHIHLCISSNGLGDSKRVRQSKADFQKMKVEFEKHILKNYPELGQSITIDKAKETPHTSKGGELKRRTGRLTKKEQTVERFREIFTKSNTKEAFFRSMSEQNLEVYTRGKTVGFLDIETGRKYRLKTLGLDTEFSRLSARLDLDGKRQVIDYSQAKGQSERVAVAPNTPKPKAETKTQEASVKNPFSKSKSTTENDVPVSDGQGKSASDQKKESEAKLEKKFGRFGTLKEWVTGDFKERSEYQKNRDKIDEEAKRQARQDARYDARQEANAKAQEEKRQEREKEARFSRVQESTRERVRRPVVSAEVEARKQRFRDTRANKEQARDKNRNPSKDGPER